MLFFDQRCFRYFDADIVPLQVVAVYDILHHDKGIHEVEIMARQIDRHGQDGQLVDQVVMELLGHLVQDIDIQFMDEPGLFQDGDEDVGHEPAVDRVFPAGQGFGAADLSGHGPDDGLIIDLDVPLFQGGVEIFQDEGPLFQGFAHVPRIDSPAARGIGLDRIAGNLGHVEGMAHDVDIVFFQQADAGLQDDVGIIDVRIDAAADDFYLLEYIFPHGQDAKAIGRKVGNEGAREILTQQCGNAL